MKIIQVTVANYRNLDGVDIALNPDITYVIGENDLGKSNFLDLLDAIFNRRSFLETDFADTAQPISVEFSLALSDGELGNFEDLFDPADSHQINLIARQPPSELDAGMAYFWKDAHGEPVQIPSTPLRRANFVKYDSSRYPGQELTFQRRPGPSTFLAYLVEDFLDQIPDASKHDYLHQENIAALLDHVQAILQQVRVLRTQGIGISTDQTHTADLLGRILRLTGSHDFDIQRSGYGVQFSATLILTILERLVRLKKSARWAEGIFVLPRTRLTRAEYDELLLAYPLAADRLDPYIHSDDRYVHIESHSIPPEVYHDLGPEVVNSFCQRRAISLILGLDEPEIHLHPYKQRSLLKYITGLLRNEEPGFLALLRQLLGVHAINGQMIVVSHSPTVLPSDHTQIVRLYRHGATIRAASGRTLDIDQSAEAHLLLHLPYIQEAFFCRCAIIAEGPTEAGALPVWIAKLIGDPDDFGIVTIAAGGRQSVRPISRLLEELKIPNLTVLDRDDGAMSANPTDAVVTQYRDFEEELFETVHSHDPTLAALYGVLEQHDPLGLDRCEQKSRLTCIARKYGTDTGWSSSLPSSLWFKQLDDATDSGLVKTMFLSWLDSAKTLSFGRFIANHTPPELIPSTYANLIRQAKQKAELTHARSH